jgi:acetylglutamate kinase
MKKLTVVKIGGAIVSDDVALSSVLDAFSTLEEDAILVHGGGSIASEIGLKQGIKPNMVDGRRVTDEQTIELVTMVYGGLINKKIVAELQKRGKNALGLTGADGNVIQSEKRKPNPVDYGFVGDVTHVNTKQLSDFIESGCVPVLAPLTYHQSTAQMLNTNADTIAAEISIALAEFYDVQLIYTFDLPGVLRDKDDPETLIKICRIAEFEQLKKDGIVAGGMIPKLENACSVAEKISRGVRIGNAQKLEELITGTTGTWIKA